MAGEIRRQHVPLPEIAISDANPIIDGKVDLDAVEALVTSGHVVQGWDEQHDISALNYSSVVAIKEVDFAASSLLSVCRGLIVNSEGTVIGRPFPRMAEVGPNEELPAGPKTVYTKYDGSLGIGYWPGDEMRLATRGRVTGERVEFGNTLLHQVLESSDYPFTPDNTYLWEVTTPDERAVKYAESGIVLLGINNTLTGEEQALPEQADVNFNVAETLPRREYTAAELRERETPNAEGYVVRMDETGKRYKVKFASYAWLETARRGELELEVYRGLRSGQEVKDYLATVPRGAQDLVLQTVAKIQGMRATIVDQALEVVARNRNIGKSDLSPAVKNLAQQLRRHRQRGGDTVHPNFDNLTWNAVREQISINNKARNEQERLM